MPAKVVLLDFDGTPAHPPGMWSQCLLDVLDESSPATGSGSTTFTRWDGIDRILAAAQHDDESGSNVIRLGGGE